MKGEMPSLLRKLRRWPSRLRRALRYRTILPLNGRAAGRFRENLLSQARYQGPLRLNRFEARYYSQNGEDGVIQEIFKRIGALNRDFVEIGVGNGQQNNTRNLLESGWRGWWVEAGERNVKQIRRSLAEPLAAGRLQLVEAFVMVENVCEVLQQAGAPLEFDLLSLDVDRNTYWIWAALRSYQPRVVVVEYNAAFPPEEEWIVPYAAQATWDGSAEFGASLKAYEKLALETGYCLVGCELGGVNAFFVRQDLCRAGLFEAPFTAEQHYEPARYYLAH